MHRLGHGFLVGGVAEAGQTVRPAVAAVGIEVPEVRERGILAIGRRDIAREEPEAVSVLLESRHS